MIKNCEVVSNQMYTFFLQKNYICPMRNLCFFIVLFFLASCDTPKSLTKKGDKFLEKELYADACYQYFKALDKKSDFIEAKEGLRNSGQKQINRHLDYFFKASNFGEQRQAIYHYRDAYALQQKINAYSISTNIPQTYTSDYKKLVDDYVETSYQQAMTLLEEEKFADSEKLLKEIALLKPDFKDVNVLKDVATFEPIYRQANSYLESEKFRSAYYEFDKIPLTYKECESRKQLALDAGLLTIGVIKFENATYRKGGETAISALIIDEMIKIDNPFIKLVDRQLTTTFIDEQVLGMSGQVSEGTYAQAGEMIGAKLLLTGKLISFSKQKNPIKETIKKGWLEKKVKKYDAENDKYFYETKYDKIKYSEFYGSNSIQLGFQFQLISVETSEILLTKLLNVNKKDEVAYAKSNHNFRNIVPGNWRWPNKNSPSDVINKSIADKRNLKALFRGKANLKSIDELANEAYMDISKDVCNRLNNYNPENE